MSLPTEIQALIVGAGPTGLAAAITLASHGVQVAVVDSSPKNANGSRASIVHAHTLEVLDNIGLAQPIIKAGVPSKGVLFRGKTNKLIEFNISQLHDVTKFPMSVHIPQHEVERIFRERLASEGIKVFRNKTVIGMHQADTGGVEVTFEDGCVVRTKYVVGADGSHSTIRHIAGVDFKDPDTGVDYDDTVPPSLQIVLADAYLEEPLPSSIPRDRLSTHLDKFLMLVPLRSNPDEEHKNTSFWRIGYGIPIGGPPAPHSPSLKYLQQLMDERNPWGTKITITSTSASSRYRVRSAVASSYFEKIGEGNILLAGDAAHVHSPVGGQGMNLGICDAVALGDAIYSHIGVKNADEGDIILRFYASSRRKTGVRVIGLAKDLTALINAGIGWRRPVRNLVLRIARHLPYMQRRAAWRISGLVNRAS